MVIWWDYNILYIYIWLVVQCAQLEKWWSSSMGRIILSIHMKWKKWLKPPTRYRLIQHIYIYICIIHIWHESSKSTRFNIFDMGWSQMYLLILWKIPWMLVFVERFGLLYHIHVDMWIISGMVAKGQLWYQLGSGCHTPHFRDGSQPTRRLFFRTKHGNVINGEALNFQFLFSCSLTCTQSVIEIFRKKNMPKPDLWISINDILGQTGHL